MNNELVEQLLDKWFDKNISPEEFRELNGLLEKNQEVAHRFAERMSLDKKLYTHFSRSGAALEKIPEFKNDLADHTRHEKRDDLICSYLTGELDADGFKDLDSEVQRPSGAFRMVELNQLKESSEELAVPEKKRKRIGAALKRCLDIDKQKRHSYISYAISAAALATVCVALYLFKAPQKAAVNQVAIVESSVIPESKVLESIDDLRNEVEYTLLSGAHLRTPRATITAIKKSKIRKIPEGWLLMSGDVSAQVEKGQGDWALHSPKGTKAQVLGTYFVFGVSSESGLGESSFLEVVEGRVAYGNRYGQEILNAGDRADIRGDRAPERYRLPDVIPPDIRTSERVLVPRTPVQLGKEAYDVLEEYDIIGLPRASEIVHDRLGGIWFAFRDRSPSLIRINIASGYIDRYIALDDQISGLSYYHGDLLARKEIIDAYSYQVNLSSLQVHKFPENHSFAEEVSPLKLGEDACILGATRFMSKQDMQKAYQAGGELGDMKWEFPSRHDLRISLDQKDDIIIGMYKLGAHNFLTMHDSDSGEIIKQAPEGRNLYYSVFNIEDKDHMWVYQSEPVLRRIKINWKK
ncbi:MAG: hypothetical protein HQL32_00685 [Planctomycetes bacterium]|nr:hypothetical protein [Planctomycetota bacterium]